MSKNRLAEKREQFPRTAKQRPYTTWAIMAAVLVLITLSIFKLLLPPQRSQVAFAFGEPVFEPQSYVGKLVPMTEVEVRIEEAMIKIPLSLLEKYSIISFGVENDQGFVVPLMAYITPSGRVFAGSSMCGPCRGRTFSLAGETLVCDTCRTTYTIEGHEFISGSAACSAYPPFYMQPLLQDGMLQIELEKVLNWRMRTD